MRSRVALVGVIGLLVTGYLIWHIGFTAIVSAALRIGWSGFSLLCIYAFLVFALLGSAWWVLVAGSRAQGWRTFLWARLVRDSAAETLPFSQIGGFVIGARAAMLDGIAPGVAAASMIADITTEMVAQLVYVCLGIALLGAQMRQATGIPSTGWLLTGVALAAIAAGSFYSLQRYGGRLIRVFAGRFLPQTLEHIEAVTSELQMIYRAPGRIGASFLIHFAGWVASGASTWIALRLLGAQVHFSSVIGVESLVYAIRSVAFAVPNALGVQEVAYVVFAPVLGVGPELGLAISLLKRAQNIAIGIPVLLLWQALEGHHAIAAARVEN
jgi:glycosyltransferase 2 family protein